MVEMRASSLKAFILGKAWAITIEDKTEIGVFVFVSFVTLLGIVKKTINH